MKFSSKSGPNDFLFSNRGWEKSFWAFFRKHPPNMPYGSPYDEEARFFREFLKMGSPISPSNLRITKEEKILLFFFSDFRHLEIQFSNRWWNGKYFFISVEKRLSNVQPGGEERKIIIFSQKRTKRHFIFQLGSERRKNHKFFGLKDTSERKK